MKNKPEYAERAVLEAMVNHFIHRDYTVMGGEVHLDIYDDWLSITSPGGMYSGRIVQDVPLEEISSDRRNPILADVMAQLDYMEKRGSGLKRICNENKALDGYKKDLKPVFKSTTTNSKPSFLPPPTHPMSETMTETCRRRNSLNAIRKYRISSKSLR